MNMRSIFNAKSFRILAKYRILTYLGFVFIWVFYNIPNAVWFDTINQSTKKAQNMLEKITVTVIKYPLNNKFSIVSTHLQRITPSRRESINEETNTRSVAA